MKTKTKVIRVKYSTWKTIRKCFPRNRGETIANYIERIVDFLLLNEEIYTYGWRENYKKARVICK